MSVDGVSRPFIFIRKEEKPSASPAIPEVDRRVYSLLSHLMDSQRRSGDIDGRLIPSDSSGRIPGMGSTGVAPEELRVRKLLESCTFQAMFSWAGGQSLCWICTYSLFVDQNSSWALLSVCSRRVSIRSDVDHSDIDTRADALAERCRERNASEVDELREELRHRRPSLEHRGMSHRISQRKRLSSKRGIRSLPFFSTERNQIFATAPTPVSSPVLFSASAPVCSVLLASLPSARRSNTFCSMTIKSRSFLLLCCPFAE